MMGTPDHNDSRPPPPQPSPPDGKQPQPPPWPSLTNKFNLQKSQDYDNKRHSSDPKVGKFSCDSLQNDLHIGFGTDNSKRFTALRWTDETRSTKRFPAMVDDVERMYAPLS